MNPTLSSGVALALLAGSVSSAEPLSEHKTWQQTYAVSAAAPRLHVRNIWGNVIVRPGTGREIVVSADERRSAATREAFERSKEQLRLDIVASAEGVSLTVYDPDRKTGRTDVCQGCQLEYQFEIAVPQGTIVDVGTITDGRVEVSGIRGPVNANNVNGPVAVSGVYECSHIETVNGALDVTFARAPGSNCDIKTINGEITVGLPATAGLNAILNVGHGDIESDFDVEPMPFPAKVDKQQRDDRFMYRIQQPAALRVGNGGPTFTMASLNGDVRILKNK
jgi:hypothetical protein